MMTKFLVAFALIALATSIHAAEETVQNCPTTPRATLFLEMKLKDSPQETIANPNATFKLTVKAEYRSGGVRCTLVGSALRRTHWTLHDVTLDRAVTGLAFDSVEELTIPRLTLSYGKTYRASITYTDAPQNVTQEIALVFTTCYRCPDGECSLTGMPGCSCAAGAEISSRQLIGRPLLFGNQFDASETFEVNAFANYRVDEGS